MSYRTSGNHTPAELLLNARLEARQASTSTGHTMSFVSVHASPTRMLTQPRSAFCYPAPQPRPLSQTNRFYTNFSATVFLRANEPLAGRGAQPSTPSTPVRPATSHFYTALMGSSPATPTQAPPTPVTSPFYAALMGSSPATSSSSQVADMDSALATGTPYNFDSSNLHVGVIQENQGHPLDPNQGDSTDLALAVGTSSIFDSSNLHIGVMQPTSQSQTKQDLQIVPFGTQTRRIIAGAGAPPPPPPGGFTKNIPLDAVDLTEDDDSKEIVIDYTCSEPLAECRNLLTRVQNALTQLRMRIDFELDIATLDPTIYASRRDLEISRRSRRLQRERTQVANLVLQATRQLTRLVQQAEADGQQEIADDLSLLLERLSTIEESVLALLPQETLEIDTRFPEPLGNLVARLQYSGTELDELTGNLIETQRNHRIRPHSYTDSRTNRIIESKRGQIAALVSDLVEVLDSLASNANELEQAISSSQIDQGLIDVLQYFISQLDRRMHFTRTIIFEVHERESQISLSQSLARRLEELRALMTLIQQGLSTAPDPTNPEHQALQAALRGMQARADEVQGWQQTERQTPTPLRSAQDVFYRPMLDADALNLEYEECIVQERDPTTGDVSSSLTRRVRELTSTSAEQGKLLQEQKYEYTYNESTGAQSTTRHIKGMENGKLVRYELESQPEEDEFSISQMVSDHNELSNRIADSVESMVQHYNALLNQARVTSAQARDFLTQAQALSDRINQALTDISTDMALADEQEGVVLTAILQSLAESSRGADLVIQHLTSLIVNLESTQHDLSDLDIIDEAGVETIINAFEARIDTIDIRLNALYGDPTLDLDARNREMSVLRRDARDIETELTQARQATQVRIDRASVDASQGAAATSAELPLLNNLLAQLHFQSDVLSDIIPSNAGSISASGRRLSFSRSSSGSFGTTSHDAAHPSRRISQRPLFDLQNQASTVVTEESDTGDDNNG